MLLLQSVAKQPYERKPFCNFTLQRNRLLYVIVDQAFSLYLREFKTQLQRRGGQRLLKNDFLFYLRNSGTFKSFTLFITVETITKVPLGHGDKFEKEINKNTRRGSRCSDNAELSHFTLLFLKVRQRNVPRIITHVNNHCSDH